MRHALQEASLELLDKQNNLLLKTNNVRCKSEIARYYRTCMANSAKYKSFCEVPKHLINTRPHCPKLMKFTCYTYAQSCNIESCIATIAIQLLKVD